MIKLDKTKNEKDKLMELVKVALTKKTYELEAIIGNNNSFDLNSKTDLIKIIKRIKGKNPYTKLTQKDSLLIFIDNPKYSKEISRIIVKGNAINQYCNQENIEHILNSVEFEKKTRVNKEERLYLQNYGIRFNLKEETMVSKDMPIVRELLKDWTNLPKSFRLKKTFQFEHEDGDFNIDLSIVSQSNNKETVGNILDKKMLSNVIKPQNVSEPFSTWWEKISKNLENMVEVRDSNKYYKSIKESRVLENTNYQYEFEVEWTGNKKENKLENPTERREFITNTIKKFLLQITYIKQAISGSFFILNKTEIGDIVKSAEKLAKCGFKSKSSTLKYFALPINLERKNMIQYPMTEYINPEVINIRMNYMVTDKADGDRNLLYINQSGEAYFISRENRVSYVGFKFADYSNSIFDGEYITEDTEGKHIMLFALFDAYIVKGHNITGDPFGLEKDSNGRHIHLKQFVSMFNKKSANVIYEDIKYKLKVFSKQFYPGDIWKVGGKKPTKDTTIFNAAEKILKKMNVKYGGRLQNGHQFSYPTDGLLFYPIHLGVKQNYVGENVNTIDGRWISQLKWKPSSHNTIDLMVKFKRESGSDNFSIEYHNDNRYYQGKLYSKIFKNRGKDGKNESESHLEFRLLNEGDNFDNLDTDYPFVPIYPFKGIRDETGNLIETSSNAKFLVSNNTVKCLNGDIIEDGAVVEFSYHSEKGIKEGSDTFSWVPERVRNGKGANPIVSAFQVWDLINNPITTDMITGKEDIGDSGIYYRGGKNYKTKPFNEFSNFVKRYVINKSLANKTKPRVLDLACGKFAAMDKLLRNGVSYYVGIDINHDNLVNQFDSGPNRMLNISKYNNATGIAARRLMDKSMFIIGDASKNLNSGEAASDELSRYYLDILYGHQKPSSKGKLQTMYGSALSQFHLVICHFAIHYMMNNEEEFHAFLLNVKENLKDQGYFVATCYDGPSLVSKVKNNGGDKVIGEINDTMIYSIDIEEDVLDDISGYGKKVEFGYETFYQPSKENLVDIDFITNEFAKFDLKLVDSKLFNEEPDNLFQQYKESNLDRWTEIADNDVLSELLSMERWMIFQKVDNLSE